MKLLRKLVTAFLTLFVLVLVGEVIVRFATDTPPPLYAKDVDVGRRYTPGEHVVFVPEAGRDVSVRFHSEGFRGEERDVDPPEGTRRVAVLGDSMILAMANEEPETLVSVLENELGASRPESRWEVMNFGASAASTSQELALYREVVSRYQPELVVCAFFVGNDLTDNSPKLSRHFRVYFDLDEDGALVRLPLRISPVSAWLGANSRLYVWQKERVRLARRGVQSMANVLVKGLQIFDSQPEGDLAEAWQLTEAVVREFRRTVEADGAKFALLLVPCGQQVYDDGWSDVLASTNRDTANYNRRYPTERLGALCEEEGIPFFTLFEGFQEHAASGGGLLFFDGIGHLTDEGNRVAAHLVHEWLAGADGEAGLLR